MNNVARVKDSTWDAHVLCIKTWSKFFLPSDVLPNINCAQPSTLLSEPGPDLYSNEFQESADINIREILASTLKNKLKKSSNSQFKIHRR